MNSPAKILRQIKRRVQSVTYGNPLYRLVLDQGEVAQKIGLSLPDLWPGDAQAGQMLIARQGSLLDPLEGVFADQETPCCHLLTQEALRDLRAVGTERARQRAVVLIQEWMEDLSAWDEESWSPPVLGARLSNWIAFYDFFSPCARPAFTRDFLICATRQLRHLLLTAQSGFTGVEGLYVVKGLIFGGLALVDRERALSLGFELLERQLTAEILPDGGHVARNPSVHAHMLRLLIDMRDALQVAGLEVPSAMTLAITRMLPVLKFFRHGDGSLALFHGSCEERALLLDATVSLARMRTRLIKRLPYMGYERVVAGRSLLVVDVGAPPLRPFDKEAHAGLMGFEFSVGREKIITNCGAAPHHKPHWWSALRATAAHSTITVCDKNACALLPEGGIAQRPLRVSTLRYEQDQKAYVDCAHDGYAQRHHVTVARSLRLSASGDQLEGEDLIEGVQGQEFSIRWHLHPAVRAMLSQDGGSVLLRTASGSGWRLRLCPPFHESPALEPSVYCADGRLVRTLQVRISGFSGSGTTRVQWVLSREGSKDKKGA
ncbi:MAG: heparinase II/III family protein [Alphaproteobacteria bacterium]|nr:heparinase II/III family protein [Alphaproteobacteria bacterium]